MSKHRSRPQAGPEYRFTAQYLKVSFVLSWLVILAIVGGGLLGSDKADRLADIIVPSMVALIVALLGIHRAFGSLDYRAVPPPAAPVEQEDYDAETERYRKKERGYE